MTDTASGGPSHGGFARGTAQSDALLEKVYSRLPKRLSELSRTKKQNEVDLHKRVGNGALGLMIGQVFIADLAFYFYGFWNDWDIPPAAITTWLAATVIQVIGVVLVITKNLFPVPADDG